MLNVPFGLLGDQPMPTNQLGSILTKEENTLRGLPI